MKTTCPCCKIENTFKEYNKHYSITAFQSLRRQLDIFHATTPEGKLEKIKTCSVHGSGDAFDKWVELMLLPAATLVREGHLIRHSVTSPFVGRK